MMTPPAGEPEGSRPPRPWNPHHPAVVVEPAPDASHIVVVRHDGYPYEEDWDEGRAGWGGLFRVADRYLALVNTRLKLLPAWLDDLREEPPGQERPPASLRWLRDLQDARHSYWVERHAGLDEPSRPETGTVLDRAAVLLAGLGRTSQGSWLPLYGGQGIRVIVQVGPARPAPVRVRITGVSSTLPPPQAVRIHEEFFKDLPARIARTFALPEEVTLVDVGFRFEDRPGPGEPAPIVFAKTAPRPGYPRERHAYDGASFLLVMRLDSRRPGGIEPLARRPLIAFADAGVFVQDPVSASGAQDFTRLRPSRSWTVLDGTRVNVQLGDLPAGTEGTVQLRNADVRLTSSRHVDPPLDENAPKDVSPPVHASVRTSTFAAVNAFHHTNELFNRMRQYGLSPAAYFRCVTRPIDVEYREGIVPGAGDGRTVNAQVLWRSRPTADSKGTIEVRFALGDLQSAAGRSPGNLPSAAERAPLSIASDPRWCWHECGHVLIAAAVGELELPFAHSVGDALAAILSDPGSRLAGDPSGPIDDTPWRGVTYPWVLIPRRHDRDVQRGWGWTGSMNRREAYFDVPGLSGRRGYWTEQILSSSLFRLYRAIGGDSTGQRQNAADYVAYLIMRTIQSLGRAVVMPSLTPHDFVSVMRKVDTATASAPGPGGYVGGTVHKVVQWAFERQGLYGLPVPGSPVSGPDEPAPVDLHIDDRRPKPDGPYSPVDLTGQDWHARPGSVWVTPSFFPWVKTRKVRVRVQNRGAASAVGTRVDVWWARREGGAIPPYPDAARWRWLGSETATVPARTEQAPGAATFGPFPWTPPADVQAFAILAAATCDADPSNIDSATGHPCVTVPTPVHLLVGCDNNLGLITLTIP